MFAHIIYLHQKETMKQTKKKRKKGVWVYPQTVSFRTTQAEKAEVEAVCRQKNISKSEFFRDLLEENLKQTVNQKN